jgi:NAD(P)-dependent dehydrogenase (short-subunit alcohol dehydrogenase family)
MSVVLITGCRSGVGLETALAFGRHGEKVYATMRDSSKGKFLEEIARRESLDIEVETLDVTDREAIERVISTIVERHGSIDVLINNAGVGGIAAAVEEIDEQDARGIVETNLWGPFHLSRAVLPAMRAQQSGVIVNISSFVTRFEGQPGLALYGLSKVALSHLSESINAELAGTNVRVVVVELGGFATEIYPPNRLVANPSSPYATLVAAIDRGVADLIAGAADPAIAARAIVDVVHDPDVSGRVLIGDDAIKEVSAYQREMIARWQSSPGS